MSHDPLSSEPAAGDPRWERAALEKIALASVQEQRRSRRWGIFFKLLGFIYLFALLFVALGWLGKRDGVTPARHTALVEINGMIASEHPGAADNVTAGLQEASRRHTRPIANKNRYMFFPVRFYGAKWSL